MKDNNFLSVLGLRRLRYFAVLAEELHFGRAAERLRIAQPALSMHIRTLEDHLGMRLFERKSRTVILTPAGNELFRHARQLLADAEQALVATRRAHRGLGGHLTIGFVHSLAYVALPPLVAGFRRAYPDVELTLQELTVYDQRDAILGRSIDVGLVRSPIRHHSIRNHILKQEHFAVAVPEGHCLANRQSVQLEELAAEDFVMFPDYGGEMGVHATLMHWFAERGITPRVVQEAKTLHTGLGLVRARLGVAMVPQSASVLQLAGVRFIPVAASPSLFIAVVSHQRNTSVLAASFCDFARDLDGRELELIPAPSGSPKGEWSLSEFQKPRSADRPEAELQEKR